KQIGEAEFGRVRDDIVRARADYPNARFSGFYLASNVSREGPGSRTITIRAVARTGISRAATAVIEIPKIERETPADDTLRHHCDETVVTEEGQISLKGWAVAEQPLQAIVVRLDGEIVGEAELGLERPDVGNHFPEIPHARQSGFLCRGHAGRHLN